MRAPDLALTRDDGTPYLNRWHILPRNRFLNLYLHQFLGSDDDRALHDHPYWFASFVLKGGYWEHRKGKPITWRSPGSLVIRSAATAHRVELETTHWNPHSWEHYGPEIPAWTLFLTGPRIRPWGFHCPNGWQHWHRFTKRNGCGEQ